MKVHVQIFEGSNFSVDFLHRIIQRQFVPFGIDQPVAEVIRVDLGHHVRPIFKGLQALAAVRERRVCLPCVFPVSLRSHVRQVLRALLVAIEGNGIFFGRLRKHFQIVQIVGADRRADPAALEGIIIVAESVYFISPPAAEP